MRDIKGWVGGAVGAAALLGAFSLGGRMTADTGAVPFASAPPSTAAVTGLEVSCAPGQRVVLHEATATSPPAAACIGDTAPGALPANLAPAAAPVVVPAVHRALATEPVEVYRPRPVAVSHGSDRDVRRPVRTKTESAVIIGGSTAIGATIGGLAKGTKGALVGGIVGGGAATVWDQVTRRQGRPR